MKCREFLLRLSLIVIVSSLPGSGIAQQTETAVASSTSSANSAVVPKLINYSGTIADASGKPATGIVGVTFFLYKDAQGGAPLWLETQSVPVSKGGHYSVMLGSTTAAGLPEDVFVSGEARWLAVQAEGQAEQPRVLLVAVPYALKAGDAETIGGLPASAFVLAGTPNKTVATGGKSTTTSSMSNNKAAVTPASSTVTTTGGTVNALPLWTTSTNIQSSALSQSGSGTSAKIGIATTAPAATLDVAGKGDIRDTLTLFPKGSDSTLAVSGTTFKLDSTGKLTFISGQTFPGTGTITGITTASGSGLSGGGTSGTLSLKVPSAGISNAMLANSKVTLNSTTAGGLVTPGAMTLGSTYTIGLKTCSTGQILQYNGTVWNCAAVGTGTITGITTSSSSGLTGGGTSGTLNIAVNPAIVAELAAANKFTNTNSVSVNSSNPALTATNANGDGVDASGGSSGVGVFASSSGFAGIDASGGTDGGFFFGGNYGIVSETDFDAQFYAGVYAGEYGSTQETFGLYGYSGSAIGVGTYGEASTSSSEGNLFNNNRAVGSWGNSGVSGAIGALGTVDDGYAGVFYNNSSLPTAWFENQETSGSSDWVLHTYGSGFGGTCSIDVSGNLACTGSITPTVPVAGGSRKVGLNAISSPEHWFEDAGSGQLSNGEAVVNIESLFGETVNTSMDYHVFLTPNGDCKGLYVTQKSATSFVVRELGGGTSSVAFDYRIMAKRKGFEQIRLAENNKMTQSGPRPAGSRGQAMPKAQDIRKAQESHLHARLAKPLLKAK